MPQSLAVLFLRLWRPLVAVAVALIGIQAVALIYAGRSNQLQNAEPKWLSLTFSNQDCRASSLLAHADNKNDPWSYHPTDNQRKLDCISEPMQLGAQRFIVLQYAGNTKDKNVSTTLLDANDYSKAYPLKLGGAARHGWLVSFIEIPKEWRDRSVRLRIQDKSLRKFGFLTISRLGQNNATPLNVREPLIANVVLRCLLVIIFASLALLYATLLSPSSAIAFIAAAASVLYLNTPSFYHWDDWAFMLKFSQGLGFTDFLVFNGHFVLGFFGIHFTSMSLVGASVGWIQLAAVLLHTIVVILLVKLLLSLAIPRTIALLFSLGFALAWVNVDMMLWPAEIPYFILAIFLLLALRTSGQVAVGRPRSLITTAVWSTLACLLYTPGLIIPWVAVAYLLVFAPKRRAAIITLAGIGVAALVMVFLALYAANANPLQAVGAPHLAIGKRIIATFTYLAIGAYKGSLLSVLGFWNSRLCAWVIGTLLALCSIAIIRKRSAADFTTAKITVFGILWLLLSYSMQAAIRSNNDISQALSFRYTYLGMLGAVVILAALSSNAIARIANLVPRLHKLGWALALVLTATLGARNVIAFSKRAEAHEREYYEQAYQQHRLALAQAFLASKMTKPIEDGPLPKSMNPSLTKRQLVKASLYLTGDLKPSVSTKWVSPSLDRELWGYEPLIGPPMLARRVKTDMVDINKN